MGVECRISLTGFPNSVLVLTVPRPLAFDQFAGVIGVVGAMVDARKLLRCVAVLPIATNAFTFPASLLLPARGRTAGGDIAETCSIR